MDPSISLHPGGRALASDHFEVIVALYQQVFSAPPLSRSPDNLALQREHLRKLLNDPSLGVVVALRGDELVGFVYGRVLKSDTTWWTGLPESVSPSVTEEWPGRTFAVSDMAVAPAFRRQGIATNLLGTLLASRPEERASLAVAPENEGAKAFYSATGWNYVGRVPGRPGEPAAWFELYVRPLRSGLQTT